MGGIKAAFGSIPANLSELGSALWNPVSASAADSELSQSVYGIMSRRFDGAVGAYAYLLFVLLYIPCVSTMAVIRQEANKRFMWTSIVWSFVVAYTTSVVFYQGAKFLDHPQQSMIWILAMSLSLLFVLAVFRYSQYGMGRQNAAANT